jgi:hypothetical protein
VSPLQKLPLRAYRIMPVAWVRWIYREDLRAARSAEARGWK